MKRFLLIAFLSCCGGQIDPNPTPATAAEARYVLLDEEDAAQSELRAIDRLEGDAGDAE